VQQTRASQSLSPPYEFIVILDSPNSLLRFGRRAMATQFDVIMPWGAPRADEAASDALDLVDRLEAQLTVYRDSSEISRLNHIAGRAPVPVESRLFALLQLARRISSETGGAFDITAGPLIKAWGFYRRDGRVPSDEELAAAMQTVGMAHVQLNETNHEVRFDRPGVEINLGSIGKGYALDRAAELLRDRWRIESALLDAGTSSVLAIGSPPNEPDGWVVGLKHPWQPRRLARLFLRNRALATSGATHQHFDYNGRKLGHVLDPRTGRPAEGIALAAALAPTAAEADALATTFFVLGIDGTRRYCAEHREVASLLLSDGLDAKLVAINLEPCDFELDETPLPNVASLEFT
jgi:thiamine biosynthesis lipoprotein